MMPPAADFGRTLPICNLSLFRDASFPARLCCRPERLFRVMTLLLASAVGRYARYYMQFASNAWTNMTPQQYGIILVSVAFFGWVLMKSGSRS
jgi:hypothetical protein